VASLLISGVPLAPVMAFWIASPSMDPEIFFLSVGFLGWDLALWRFGGTFVLSLAAGLLTHLLLVQGWLGRSILRQRNGDGQYSPPNWLKEVRQWLRRQTTAARMASDGVLTAAAPTIPLSSLAVTQPTAAGCGVSCCDNGANNSCRVSRTPASERPALSASTRPSIRPPKLWGHQVWGHKIWQESWAATRLVIQFMALAFLLEALIVLYVPQAWIVGLLGSQNQWAVPLAALLGVPVYTSNLTALPLISGLLEQGMSAAAALAFLIAGPTTTLPAMAAVWGLVQRRVFGLYVAFSLVGALLLGLVYTLIG
jgi:uncharacterized protein